MNLKEKRDLLKLLTRVAEDLQPAQILIEVHVETSGCEDVIIDRVESTATHLRHAINHLKKRITEESQDKDTPPCAGCPDNAPWTGVRMCEVEIHGKNAVSRSFTYYCFDCRSDILEGRSDIEMITVFG